MEHEKEVRELYRTGVAAVGQAVAGLDGRGWDQTVCGTWSATETMRHLCAVVGWYEDWLDRSLQGEVGPPFAHDELAEQNARALEGLGDLSGPDGATRFERAATAYVERAGRHLDEPYGFPLGTVTVGLHLGVAATEWHLHAWDLTGHRHEPEDPGALFSAAGRAVAAATGGTRGWVLGAVVPLGARVGPWSNLLRRSGR